MSESYVDLTFLVFRKTEGFKMEKTYRDLLRECNYPEEVLANMTDEDCEGECDVIGVTV